MYLCITNRKLCPEPLPERILKLNRCEEIEKIILREKDLNEREYAALAEACLAVCEKPMVIHTYTEIAESLGVKEVHLSINDLRNYRGNLSVGVSVHSVSEAVEAERLGASYLTAGHIFATDCKKGLPPRGCDFLQSVCQSVKIPVYGIGGISPQNIQRVLESGAAGGCRMSGFMR